MVTIMGRETVDESSDKGWGDEDFGKACQIRDTQAEMVAATNTALPG